MIGPINLALVRRFRARQIIDEFDRIAPARGKPRSIRVDNGPELAGRLLDQRAYLNKVELDFSRPETPNDNAYLEAFNRRVRQECLNASWFLSAAYARHRINEWRIDCNVNRPNSALGNLTPSAECGPTSTNPKGCMTPGPDTG